jgi:hypothetical protein
MSITIKAHARERRVRKRKPASNLLEVLNFLSRANRTEVRTIINSINEMPSYMRGKEVQVG